VETANSTCANHRDRPGTHRCAACHKPLCAECVLNAGDAIYCSAACAGNPARFAARHEGAEKEFFARAGSSEGRRGSAVGSPAPRTSWAAVGLAFLLGGGVVACVCHLVTLNGVPAGYGPGVTVRAASAVPPEPKPTATQSTEVSAEDTREAPVSPAQPPAPEPRPLTLPSPQRGEGRGEGAAPQDLPIIGARVPLGKLAIELEDYWLEPDPPADAACAALSGCIVNNSAAALTLPQVEVTLLDGRQREYKSCKAKLATNVTLNPLMRARGQWAFQVPAKMPMWCAQFTIKEGKDSKAVCIGVNKRTSENTQLVGSDDYRATSDELKAFASPRFLLQQQHEKELAKMDLLAADLDAAQRRLARTERQRKTAETAVAAARVAADRRAAARKDAEAAVRDLDANRPAFIHDEPRWERQAGESKIRLERATSDAASALKNVQDRVAQRDKAANQEREEKRQFDMLKTRFDAQRKVLDDLEKKMAE